MTTGRAATFLQVKRLLRLRPWLTDAEVMDELAANGSVRAVVAEVLPEARRDLEAGDWHLHERPEQEPAYEDGP